ncbi:MAG: CBS domain-containing protein [Gammaproteobacteria bacterium]|nr:CBS domain-containing protein [Gammaproteobacteria bacterium]
MPVLELKRSVNAAPELVWQVVSDMEAFARVAPSVTRVDVIREPGTNLRRQLVDKQGRSWDEERIAVVPGQSLTMRVDSHYFSSAFSSMKYTWSVLASDQGAVIHMRYEYRVKWGIIGGVLDRFRFRQQLRSVCEDILSNWISTINAREWAWRVTVSRILARKGAGVFTVNATDTLTDAAVILAEQSIGCLPVIDPQGQLVGMLSERDIVTALTDNGTGTMLLSVSAAMTKKVVVAAPDDSMEVVMNCMNDRRIRHLPIMDGDALVGLISIGDVVNARIAELEGESTQLRDFIETRRFNDLYRRIGPAAYDSGLAS